MKKNTLQNQSGVKSQTQGYWSKKKIWKMINCDR